jgi:PIN domain nuclease of toxin-antitoxin system
VTVHVLDTHAWLWLAVGDSRLRRHAATLTRSALAGDLALPAIAVFEATLIGVESHVGKRKGQAVHMRPTVQSWMRDALVETRVFVAELSADAALDAGTMYTMHDDPFDRLIVATALALSGILVTADAKVLPFARSVGLRLLTP